MMNALLFLAFASYCCNPRISIISKAMSFPTQARTPRPLLYPISHFTILFRRLRPYTTSRRPSQYI